MSFFEFMVYGFAIIGAMSVLFFALAFVYLSMICIILDLTIHVEVDR